jgi:hypothetical protein
MSALFKERKPLFANSPAEAAATRPVPAEHKNVFYRFYGKSGEIFWEFVYPPTNFCLDMTCKMLRFPNYEEIDEAEFRKGYRH